MSEAAQPGGGGHANDAGKGRAISPLPVDARSKSPTGSGDDDWRPVALKLIDDLSRFIMNTEVVKRSSEPKIFVQQDPIFDSNSTCDLSPND